jgi:hypothetical protein
MTPKLSGARPAGTVRRIGGAARSLRPLTVISLTLAMVVGGAGIAGAATGGAFILGRANSEAAKATLSDSRGTPLSLAAPAGKAPPAWRWSATSMPAISAGGQRQASG